MGFLQTEFGDARPSQLLRLCYYVPSVAYKMLADVLYNDVPDNFSDPAAFGSYVTPATFGTFAAQFRGALALADKRARSLSDASP